MLPTEYAHSSGQSRGKPLFSLGIACGTVEQTAPGQLFTPRSAGGSALGYPEEDRVMSLTMRIMKAVMFKVSRSKHGFEQTVEMVRENALRVGWDVPWRFELQQHYRERGLSDMTKVVNIYLCNPQGGYDIMKDDVYKPMAVMMPTAVSVYETSGG